MPRREPGWSVSGPGAACAQVRRLGLLILLIAVVLMPTAAATAISNGQHSSSPRPAGVSSEDISLTLTITSLTPSVLNGGGTVTVRGSIENTSDVTVTNVKVYLFNSTTPITTREGLDEAAESDPNVYLGDRVVDPGTFAEIADVLPPQSRIPYEVQVPYEALGLSGEAGVYWVGTHVLATGPDGVRPEGALGRARTFMVLPPGGTDGPGSGVLPAVTSVAMLWPVTSQPALVGEDLFAEERLGAEMAVGGRLRRLVQAGAGRPLTWVVDPAVIDAAQSMADGYQVRTDANPVPGLHAADAAAFLDELAAATTGQTVLELPYGDPDSVTLLRSGLGDLLAGAHELGGSVDTADASLPTAWPLEGRAPPGYLQGAYDAGAQVAILDQAFAAEAPSTPLAQIDVSGQPMTAIFVDRALSAGGPGPDAALTPIQLRQRLLAVTAILSFGAEDGGAQDSGDDEGNGQGVDAGLGSQSLIATVLPRTWETAGGDPAQIFAGLDSASWLRLAPLGPVEPSAPTAPLVEVDTARPRVELGAAHTDALAELADRSQTLAAILADADSLVQAMGRVTTLAASTQWVEEPTTGLAYVTERNSEANQLLSSVTVQGTPFVTLSSDSGRFPVTVTNQLDRAVEVGLHLEPADDGLRIGGVDSVMVGPNQQTTLNVTARSERIGVTSVTVRPATPGGEPFGAADEFEVRATDYGLVAWWILGGALALLFATSAFRIGRRVARHRDHEHAHQDNQAAHP